MWIVFSLLAALSAAVVVTLSKAGIKTVDSSLAFAIQSILIVLVAWSVVAWQGNLPDVAAIDRRSWVFLIAAGVITCVSSLLSFRALSLGNASRVSPLDKVSLVFAIMLAAVFLKEKISWQVMLGAGLMVVGAVVIAMAKPAGE
ncbi:EamA family transporter [Hymenobacter tibetensis]|uniref:EamA family transporter n=1 Tax=Hymenobacter tibetensis TaxID=497967 RepID=A0ABY4CTP7_9BACT|nr:EamA family transporter [Hymenobacter tibetensis]UOG73641.1 EamA family transporter [Hymenobacter tibetensis]